MSTKAGQLHLHANLRVVLTEPVDVDALERGRPDPPDDDLFVRFPADKITDVATSVSGRAQDGREYCQALLAPRFEKLGKVWKPHVRTEQLVWVRRRTGETEGGRPILLDTNTSAVDVRWKKMTPGGLGFR